MKSNISIILCGGILFLSLANSAFAQFPYYNKGNSSDDFNKFNGSENVEYKEDGIILTTKAKQTNGVFLDELLISTKRGFILGFDYLMTGKGSGANQFGANGIGLVFFDAHVENPTIGSGTAGLGYSCSKAETISASVPGMTRGFFNIGLDIEGDSKLRKTLKNEYRNGVYTGTNERNHLTIRGQGDQFGGYPVLLSQSVTNIDERYKLDLETGLYTQDFNAPDPNRFSFKLRENNANNESDINASFGHPSYRRVILSALPIIRQGIEGYSLNVDMIYGNQTSRIVHDLFVPFMGTVKYTEALAQFRDVLITTDIRVPEVIKMGFTATTGTVYQKNIIRNINLTLPFSPLVKNVVIPNACIDHTTTLDVLADDVGFDTNEYIPGQDLHSLGTKEHLDPYSFRFAKLENNMIEYTIEPFVLTTNAGRYEYNPLTMEVVFIPKKGMKEKEDIVYYSIKNKRKKIGTVDLGEEQYRSENAVIRLNFTHNCNDIIMVNGGVL